ncbi:hypothetical protein [Aliikangiella sp. IMCC44359]|uniref:hypothetical protein n=1 Tax=Aliikangiella sp. IMCC44359 TaxID=3459125 RepID=UPI00403B22FF
MSNLKNPETNKVKQVIASDKKKEVTKPKKVPAKTNKEVSGFSVVFKSKARKLSPKAEGYITYQLIKDTKGILSIQLLENTSGGIFSKNPIPLKSVIDTLGEQDVARAFKSSLMKNVFTGKGSKSANNTSFLIAVLRSKEIGLVVPNDKSQFLSNLSPDFKAKAKSLLAK